MVPETAPVCERCRDNLLEYLYGLLEGDEARALERHLPECAACRAELDQARRAQGLLSRAAQVARAVAPFTLPGSHTLSEPAATGAATGAAAGAAASAAASSLPLQDNSLPAGRSATLPLEAAPRRKSPLRRYWPAWAAAASILAAVVGLISLYNQGKERRVAEVNRVRKKIHDLDASFAALKKENADLLEVKVAEAKGGADKLHLHVVGTTRYNPAVPPQYRVEVRDTDGVLVPARVELELRDSENQPVLEPLTVKADAGKALLPLPGGLSWKGAAKLTFKASTEAAQVELTGPKILPAPVSPPTFATHLVLNKNTFSANEMVFFRALTLDQVSHQPPREPVTLRFSLLDMDGRSVLEMGARTNEAGISAGNFTLGDDLPGGSYTLLAQSDGKTREKVLPQAQVVELIPDGPEVVFQQGKPRPGELVQVYLRRKAAPRLFEMRGEGGRGNEGEAKKAGDKGDKADRDRETAEARIDTYDMQFLVDGKPVPALNAGQYGTNLAYGPNLTQRINTDTLGNAVVTLKLPKEIQKDAVLVLEKKMGKGAERYWHPLPLADEKARAKASPETAPGLNVDFFPEGGTLVAGVENKVYFRVRSASGAGLDPDRLVIHAGGNILYRSGPLLLPPPFAWPAIPRATSQRAGLGYFHLVPREEEQVGYLIFQGDPSVPIAGMKTLSAVMNGIALSVRQPVGPGDPIEVDVRAPHPTGKAVPPERQVLLAASCKGVVFDQQLLTLRAQGKEKKPLEQTAIVRPPAGVDGVLRLTLFEVQGTDLRTALPLAERLVYRAPAERVAVTCTPASGPYYPGSPLKLDIEVEGGAKKDGAGKKNDWYLGVVVADERGQTPFSEHNLFTFFHVGPHVSSGGDLDGALIHLNQTGKEGQDAATALDLFLSIHGWRRFNPETGTAAACLSATGLVNPFGEVALARVLQDHQSETVLPFFSRESSSLSTERLARWEESNQHWEERQTRANQKRALLLAELETAQDAGRAAKANLDQYVETFPVQVFWRIMGGLLALLLAAGALGLLYGVYVYSRGASPRPGLAFSMLCLVLAFGLYFGGKRYQPEVIEVEGKLPGWLGAKNWEPFPRPLPRHVAFLAKPTPTPPVWKYLASNAPLDAGPSPVGDFLQRDQTMALTKGFDDTLGIDQRPGLRDELALADGKATTNGALPQDSFKRNIVDLEGLFNFNQDEFRKRLNAAPRASATTLIRAADPAKGAKDKKEGKKELAKIPHEDADKPFILFPPPQLETEAESVRPVIDEPEDDNLKLLVREYAFRTLPLRPRYQHTVFWSPALIAKDGQAQVRFDLSPEVSAYRVLLFANHPDGRLGFYEGRLEMGK